MLSEIWCYFNEIDLNRARFLTDFSNSLYSDKYLHVHERLYIPYI